MSEMIELMRPQSFATASGRLSISWAMVANLII
jgi:hypothetical protein